MRCRRFELVGGVCDAATANLLSVFKGAVLVPIPIGATQQEIRSLPVPLLAEVLAAGHRQRLATCSIAVALGAGGLTAIFFDARNQLLDFLTRNPVLTGTLVTCHGETFITWIEADVPHQMPISTSDFSVMTDGKVMVYDRAATAKPGYFLTTAKPMKVDLQTLDWGPDPDGRIAAWLVSLRHGQYFLGNGRGVLKPNPGAWTEFLARRLKQDIQYRRTDRFFLVRDPESGAFNAVGEITSNLLPKLRAGLTADPMLPDPFLLLFLQEAVVPQKGSNFTFGELYSAFDRVRVVRGWPSFSAWDLGKSLRRLMAEPPYHKRVSKSVPRENGS